MIQQRNPQLVELLRADFRHLNDPLTTFRSTANLSTPPTDAELDAEFGVPTTLPENMLVLVDINGAGTNMYLCLADSANNKWWYITWTASP